LKAFYSFFAIALILLVNHSANAQCNNLLVNGDAASGLTGWTFSSGIGTNWTTQGSTYGSAFVASYNWSTMSQQIDLLANGYTQAELNQEPKISYMQMYKGHTVNYADQYYYKIELLTAANTVLASYNLGSQASPIITTSAWDTVAGTLDNYGAGLRYVKVSCGGNDAEFWSGHYGTIIDNSIVSVEEIVNAQICNGTYSFNGQTFSTTGLYSASFTGQYGCDSNVLLNLNVGGYDMHDTFQLCNGDTFLFNGQPVTSTDTVSFMFTSAAGCDSLVTNIVEFKPTYDQTIDAFICPGGVFIFGNQFIFNPGTYSGSFTSVHGCDSNVTVTVDFSTTNNDTVTAYLCDGETYQFGNLTLTTAGQYNGVFSNQYGCDSTVALTLMNGETYTQNLNLTLCDGETYQFGSIEISQSGTYSDLFFTVHGGCDSLVNLNVVTHQIDETISLDGETGTLSSNETQPNATFQWLSCNNGRNPIPGETSSTYTSTIGGRFALETTVGNCRDTSSCKRVFPLGENSIDKIQNITLYPTPANESLTISSAESMLKIIVTNIEGRVIYQSQFNGKTNAQLPTQEWSNGYYTVSVKLAEGFVHLPCAVQH